MAATATAAMFPLVLLGDFATCVVVPVHMAVSHPASMVVVV